MNDNIENSETTTISETTVIPVPSETESVTAANIYQVSLYIPDIGYVDGTITGGYTSEIVSILEDIKQQQEHQNDILMNLSVISLLCVALFGILIAQGFVKLLKR